MIVFVVAFNVDPTLLRSVAPQKSPENSTADVQTLFPIDATGHAIGGAANER